MSKFARLALAGALCGICSVAAAADATQAIAVTASVAGVCKLSAPSTLAITADPSTGSNASATAPVSFQCTKNKSYTFTVSDGTTTTGSGTLPGNLSDGQATPVLVPFTASWTPPSGTGIGFSTPVNADLLVTIGYADYQDKPAGSYTGTLTVNINY